MSQELFRQEVLDAKRGEWLGSIIVATPLSRWMLISLAWMLAAAILLLLCFGHYTRRETVTGQLVPSGGLLNIAAPSIGTVKRLHVHDGQAVKAGDALLELSSEQDSPTLGDTHDRTRVAGNAAVNHLAITCIVIAHRHETIASARYMLVAADRVVQPIPSRLRDVDVAV